MPYDETKSIPQGYRVEERIRRGPVIAGAIVLGVPYVLGLNVAAAEGFDNHSYWLLVPGFGPFLTLGTRDDACNEQANSANNAGDCLGDALIDSVLVMDGIMQTAGGVLLLVGALDKKKVLVREQAALGFGPRRVGTGYGVGLWGEL